MEKKPSKYDKLTFQEKLLMYQKKNRRRSDSQVLMLLAGLMALVLIGQIFGMFTAKAAMPVKKDAKFTATMVGDMMFGRNVDKVVQQRGYDYLFSSVKPHLAASDYNTGNFENPIILRDEKEYTLPEKSIFLHAKPDVAPYLDKLGFNSVNLANNHAMDYGVAGLTETLDTFSKTKTAVIGLGLNKTQSNTINYQTVNGIKVAVLGSTEVGYAWGYATNHQAGANKTRMEDLLPKVQEAKNNADLVIVHSHWGVEYDTNESPKQQQIGHALVKAGADIVVGHHSHTLQPIEIYQGKVIMYSLGNFIFDQGWTKTKDSVLAQYKIKDDGSKTLELTPMKIEEAAPRFLSGPLAGFEFNRMAKILTKRFDQNVKWKKADGKIVIDLGKE